jgi:hypothetical protein
MCSAFEQQRVILPQSVDGITPSREGDSNTKFIYKPKHIYTYRGDMHMILTGHHSAGHPITLSAKQ